MGALGHHARRLAIAQRILAHLVDHGPCTVKEIAQVTELSTWTVRRVVDLLIIDGLVTERLHYVAITMAGLSS